ncbi:UNVERIFIED_CONTAM: hypothetical protein HDU68_008546 [Siphonaria sp. JEL0065]|nr:hypothetical protein HDU68_008546 [Siphonaria sp. JEL0065]
MSRIQIRLPLAVAGSLSAVFVVDHYGYASALQRNLRTVWTGVKMTYEPGNFEAVHQKVADMILDTCSTNSGLYIKCRPLFSSISNTDYLQTVAQQIATFSTILPPQWSNFKKLYDQAPSIPYDIVVKTIKAELGAHPDNIFDDFEPTPLASASIAQVHRARLKSTGELVAVKVQKPDVGVQIEADLFTFKIVINVLERVFDLPMTWTIPTIDKHLREELDFVHEARNSEIAEKFIQQVPSLRDDVHVPKIHWDYTTKRVMTTEWIEGINFGHVETVKQTWGHERVEKMMTVLVNLFSDQIFRTGFIHCDPHPGNILLRPNPEHQSRPQIVLLDHGLYIQSSPEFTQDYTRLWTSLFSHDLNAVESIVKRWGINDVQLFAIGTLQKPWSKGKGMKGSTVRDIMDTPKLSEVATDPEARKKEMYDRQMKMKERARQYLADTNKIPRELIFVGRNLNIVRANNKIYGSPVNRINLACAWAVKTAKEREKCAVKPTLLASFTYTLLHPSNALQPIRLYSTMLFVAIAFQTTKWWNAVVSWWNWVMLPISGSKEGGKGIGFEEVMEQAVRQGVYEQTGALTFNISIRQRRFDAEKSVSFARMSSRNEPKDMLPVTPPTVTDPKHRNLDLLSKAQWASIRALQSRITHLFRFEPNILTDTPLPGEQQLATTNECAWRYLQEYKFNIDKAEAGLIKTLQWRRKFRPTEITPEEVEEEFKTGKGYWHGYDRRGRPIFHIDAAKLKSADSERYIKFFIFNLEHGPKLCPEGVLHITIVIEVGGLTAFNLPPITDSIKILNALQSHYPGRLGILIFVNPSWAMWTFFKILSPLIDPNIKAKMHFVSSKIDSSKRSDVGGKDEGTGGWVHDVDVLVPLNQLPVTVGGTSDIRYDHETYWNQFLEAAFEK